MPARLNDFSRSGEDRDTPENETLEVISRMAALSPRTRFGVYSKLNDGCAGPVRTSATRSGGQASPDRTKQHNTQTFA